MSQRTQLPPDLREFAESFYSAANRRDPEAITALIDPEFEFNSRLSAVGRYRGADGVREWLRDVDGAFDEMRFELQGIAAASERAAVAEVTGTGRRRGGGGPLSVHVVHAWTFRSGRLWRALSFGNRADAERAARG